jgi:hypothetical protein
MTLHSFLRKECENTANEVRDMVDVQKIDSKNGSIFNRKWRDTAKKYYYMVL